MPHELNTMEIDTLNRRGYAIWRRADITGRCGSRTLWSILIESMHFKFLLAYSLEYSVFSQRKPNGCEL